MVDLTKKLRRLIVDDLKYLSQVLDIPEDKVRALLAKNPIDYKIRVAILNALYMKYKDHN